MLRDFTFTYDNQPALLKFSDAVGELSEIWYMDKGVNTQLIIHKFSFDEQILKLEVNVIKTVYYNDSVTIIKGPDRVAVDATSQESLTYFQQFTYDYPKIKRQEVNGTSIEFLGFPLFDETGAFNPQYPEAPVDPI